MKTKVRLSASTVLTESNKKYRMKIIFEHEDFLKQNFCEKNNFEMISGEKLKYWESENFFNVFGEVYNETRV